MGDGSVLVVEIRGKTLVRVQPNGDKEVIAELARPEWSGDWSGWALLHLQQRRFRVPPGRRRDASGTRATGLRGRLDRAVDLATGRCEVSTGTAATSRCEDPSLVFDRHGGLVHRAGKVMRRQRDRGAVFYARSDDLHQQVIFPLGGRTESGFTG